MSGFHSGHPLVGPLAQGFWLGLSTGPYCFAACAPFLVPYLCAEGRPAFADSLMTLARFLAGRLLAYLAFGAAAGALGAAVGSRVPAWLPAAALAASALLMLACAARAFPGVSWCAAAGRWATPQRVPFAMGLLTGINVCPPFLTGMVVVLALGSAASGAAFFAAFFAATSLYLLPVLGVWPWLSAARVRSVGRWALGLAGAWYLLQAVRMC
ncbi:MAG: sulfite exporter TauE/SafE family protein [Elusimicrobia bacterium]|nr:sulfite exporter TauE/SafE family protein [Elusimicrobiota bacterium]